MHKCIQHFWNVLSFNQILHPNSLPLHFLILRFASGGRESHVDVNTETYKQYITRQQRTLTQIVIFGYATIYHHISEAAQFDCTWPQVNQNDPSTEQTLTVNEVDIYARPTSSPSHCLENFKNMRSKQRNKCANMFLLNFEKPRLTKTWTSTFCIVVAQNIPKSTN